jgi:hypothetical protein
VPKPTCLLDVFIVVNISAMSITYLKIIVAQNTGVPELSENSQLQRLNLGTKAASP